MNQLINYRKTVHIKVSISIYNKNVIGSYILGVLKRNQGGKNKQPEIFVYKQQYIPSEYLLVTDI